MSSFDPNKLGNAGAQPKARPERLFVKVEEYLTPQDGYHYAVGHRLDDPEQKVKVRLNTVNERLQDRPNENPDKVKQQYTSPDKDNIGDKKKNGITLLSFDDARKVATAEGVTEYRAHWATTISTDPKAEVMVGMAHIRLKDAVAATDNRRAVGAQAYVELFKDRGIATADNIDAKLAKGLAINDEQARARDPLVILRVMHDGKQVAAPRIYPETEKTKVFDQTLGEHKEVSRPVDAAKTLAKVLGDGPGRDDFQTRQFDTVRALVAGLKGQDEPKFASADKGAVDAVRNLYYGAKQGHLVVEVVEAEKIDFGLKSRQTYLSNKARPHLAAYMHEEEAPNNYMKTTPQYTETVLAVDRYPNGEPFAVFASPLKAYPRMVALAELPLAGDPRAEKTREAAAEAPAERRAPEPEAEREPATADFDDGPGM